MEKANKIKKGQKLCLLGTACGRCPYYNVGHGVAACMGRLTQDTIDYIQQLETEDAQKAQRIAGLEQEKFDVLDGISTAYYGKMMYGLNDDGTVYSRYSCEDMTFDEAVQELVSLLYKENE